MSFSTFRSISLIPALLTMQAILLVALLGIPPVGGSSEAREMQVIDIMYRTGEVVLPLRNGVVPSKPPLYHWCGLLAAKVFGGADEFVSRLPSVVFAIGLLGFVAGVCSSLLRLDRSGVRDREQLISLALIATTLMYGFIHMAQRAMVDMTFAFWCWSAWYFGLRAVVERSLHELEKIRQWKTLFWASCGIAVLSRGPIGIVVPASLLFVGSCCILGWRDSLKLWLTPTIGWVVCAAIFSPWYLLAFERGGDAFFARQLLFENIKRFQGGEFVNAEPFWYYVPSLIRTAFPWSAALGCLLIWKFRRTGFRVDVLTRVSLAMAIAGVVIFSIASGKRHSYMLPMYPFVGLATASLLFEWGHSLSDSSRRSALQVLNVSRIVAAALLFILSTLLCLSITLSATVSPMTWELQVWLRDYRLPVISFVVVAALATLWGGRYKDLRFRAFYAWFGFAALSAVIICVGTGIKGRIKNFEQIADAVSLRVPADAALAVMKHERDEFFDPVLYYLRRPVELLERNPERQECREYSMTLGSWFDEVGENALRARGFEVNELARYNDLSDAEKGKHDREMVLFTCRAAPVESRISGGYA